MTRSAIQKDLEKVRKLLEDTTDTKTALQAEIKELVNAKSGIKSDRAKLSVQKDIDALTAQMNRKEPPKPHQQYKSELKSLADGYTKILAVMENIPFYITSTRGRKPGTKMAKLPGGQKRAYNRKAK